MTRSLTNLIVASTAAAVLVATTQPEPWAARTLALDLGLLVVIVAVTPLGVPRGMEARRLAAWGVGITAVGVVFARNQRDIWLLHLLMLFACKEAVHALVESWRAPRVGPEAAREGDR
jgi:hypothetical protein